MVERTEVMSLKKHAAGLLAVSLASFVPLLHAAPTLVVNGGSPVDIQTPPGFSYVANGSGTSSELGVNVDGFVFCANIGAGTGAPVTLQPLRTRWLLPSGNDGRIAYSGGKLGVNHDMETSLACQMRDASGRIRSPFSGYGDVLFSDDWEDFHSQERQYSNLVNWKPTRAFTWLSPNWSRVPNDSCTWDRNDNFPRLDETALCAAATGVRPNASGSPNNPDYGDRAPTMWTKRTTANYIYVARIDASYGGQHGTPNSHFAGGSPRPVDVDTPSTINVAIRDAFDATYLSANATYCFLSKLPGSLTDDVCNHAVNPDAYFTNTLPNTPLDPNSSRGIMVETLPLGVNTVQARSLYIAVVRQKAAGGGSPSACQPYAAISVIPQQDVARYFAADEFIGDDVVFGFREDEAFDWMGCID